MEVHVANAEDIVLPFGVAHKQILLSSGTMWRSLALIV